MTCRSELGDFFAGKKQYLMESFYRMMRKKWNVLMDGANPAGGQWNFDHDNREKMDADVKLPPKS
jgi:deoxyribodipyrimidine photolyase-related protein